MKPLEWLMIGNHLEENQHIDLGGVALTWLNGGYFKLDGGAMFGVVPKMLWSTKYPPDSDNLIQMRAAPLLVQTPRENILIDTGLGNKLTIKQRDIYKLTRPWSVDKDLERLNLTTQDIGWVILTHCDFDHAGGLVSFNKTGDSKLTFPKARHVIHILEWQGVRHPNSRSVHSYFPENFSGLEESGLLDLIDSDREITSVVTVRHTGGHTPGHQLVEIRGDSYFAVHLGDLMPTHAHANPLWTMAYDDFPLEVIELKQRLVEQYNTQEGIFTFYHDVFIAAGRIDEKHQTAALC